MNVLIDTTILLYLLFDDDHLTKSELKILMNDDNEIIISSISLFEISLKYSLNKLELVNISPEDIPALLLANGYVIEDVNYTSFATFYKLPSEHHRDPFDRLLIWEAINKDYYLLSRDSKFTIYEKHGLKLLK